MNDPATTLQWNSQGVQVHVLYSRAGIATQILISSEKDSILIDLGDGALRDLIGANFDFATLRGIAITHGHYDHMGGLWSLMGYLRLMARTEPLRALIPKGSRECEAIIKGFYECYPKAEFRTEVTGVEDGNTINVGSFEVKPYSVNHRGSTRSGLGAPIPAFGFSVECGGVRIAISGDSSYCENLERLMNGADLALVEASWGEEPNLGHEGVHLTVKEAKKLGEMAKEYRIIHMTKKSREVLEREDARAD